MMATIVFYSLTDSCIYFKKRYSNILRDIIGKDIQRRTIFYHTMVQLQVMAPTSSELVKPIIRFVAFPRARPDVQRPPCRPQAMESLPSTPSSPDAVRVSPPHHTRAVAELGVFPWSKHIDQKLLQQISRGAMGVPVAMRVELDAEGTPAPPPLGDARAGTGLTTCGDAAGEFELTAEDVQLEIKVEHMSSGH